MKERDDAVMRQFDTDLPAGTRRDDLVEYLRLHHIENVTFPVSPSDPMYGGASIITFARTAELTNATTTCNADFMFRFDTANALMNYSYQPNCRSRF